MVVVGGELYVEGFQVWTGGISESFSEEITVIWGLSGCIGVLRQLEGELGGEDTAAKRSTKPGNV